MHSMVYVHSYAYMQTPEINLFFQNAWPQTNRKARGKTPLFKCLPALTLWHLGSGRDQCSSSRMLHSFRIQFFDIASHYSAHLNVQRTDRNRPRPSLRAPQRIPRHFILDTFTGHYSYATFFSLCQTLIAIATSHSPCRLQLPSSGVASNETFVLDSAHSISHKLHMSSGPIYSILPS